ncbi:MAG: ABC transporter ATP-binding protein [Candidatus Sumerlaeota bacterium]|nr:ABC transporter ATP-binding protein [Candidatus Sumerlaeota bacterium]
MSLLEIQGLSKRFGAHAALADVSLQVERGEWFGLLGPSGAGKTTLLRLVAGLDVPDGGTVVLENRQLSRLGHAEPPESRGIGMVFQTLGLWAHLDARSHLDLVLRRMHATGQARRREIERLLAMARLEGKGARRPGELSGGERQRLAVARALAPRPRLLLLDEPFAHVDAPLRDEVAHDLSELIRTTDATVLLVSHDAEHAASLCGRVASLNAGRIEQVGSPREVYESPRTAAAARMTGPAFLLEGEASGGTARTAVGAVAIRDRAAAGPGWVCLRPESFSLNGAGEGRESFAVQLSDAAFIGGRWRVAFQWNGREFWTWRREVPALGAAAAMLSAPAAWVPADSATKEPGMESRL